MTEESKALPLVSKLEAILFAAGEPVPVAQMATACEVSDSAIITGLKQLTLLYAERKSAICIRQLGDCWQMHTREEYAETISDAMETKKNIPLSSAALEVLTIVAYNQPVTKSFVEHVRGVDSSSIVNTLVEKELLVETGRLDLPGRPILYGTTPNFLRCFQLSSLEDLPPLPTELPSSEAEALQQEVTS